LGSTALSVGAVWGITITAAIVGGILALFLVGIPARIALNVLMRERRRKYFRETVSLFLAFAALAWMLYTFFAYPPEG
jgi:hypothetical protein